jgi:hypothetical protein
VNVTVGVGVGVEVGFGVGVGGGGTGVFVGRISIGSVLVGAAFTSGVKVAIGVPSPGAIAVGVGVFVGAEVIAAELQATIRNNKTNNCTHNSFFILSSSSKWERSHYNPNLLI